MRLLAFFVLFLNSICANYYIGICAFFQDEGLYLKEWIEFHRLVGVEKFYLYNNCSQDNFLEVLEPYCDSGIVTLVDWPFYCSGNWDAVQAAAYNDCLELAKKEVFWLAIIDSDEFIVPVEHNTLKEFLAPYENYAGIEIAWQTFGTSLF